MNSNETAGVAVMESEVGNVKKSKAVIIITALILANIVVAGLVLSWRL